VRDFHEKQLDGIFFSLISLFFHHGRPLGLARVVVLKRN
jgi:hypothetical protein